MKIPTIKQGLLLGAITGFPLMALLYLGEQFANLPFVPFDIFDWLARTLPGNIITLGIDSLVDTIVALKVENTSQTAKTLEQLLALTLFLALTTLLGGLLAWLVQRSSRPGWQVGTALGLAAFALVFAVELTLDLASLATLSLLWLVVLSAGWGAVLGFSLEALAGTGDRLEEDEPSPARRAIILRVAGGSLGLTLGVLGLGQLFKQQSDVSGASQDLTELAPTPTASPRAVASPTLTPQVTATATIRDRVQPAQGTRPEHTPTEQFYRIDINTRSPVIKEGDWVLEIEGLFESPRNLTLADLMAYPPVTQPITLSCISNRVGGDLIGTSFWTGARLRDVLADLGMLPEARELQIAAADGFYESVQQLDMMDPRTLLVYGMDDQTLPVDHGFPLRIYIPDRYGMKQPKWITKMTALDEAGRGYWVERGWSEEARPQIVSVIDTIAVDDAAADGQIAIGGIAWAGERGIKKVELQIDDSTWQEAILRTPPLGPLTWVQWRYDWVTEPGNHTFRVRAVDGTGTLQIEKESGVRPDGATGYHSRKIRI